MHADNVLLVLFSAAAGAFLYYLYTSRHKGGTRRAPGSGGIEKELYRLSEELVTYYQASAHPEDLLKHSAFLQGIGLLVGRPAELVRYIQGDNAILACMALEATSRREDARELEGLLLSLLNVLQPWPRYFALKALRTAVPAGEAIMVPVLLSTDTTWQTNPSYRFLWGFMHQRLSGGEKPVFGEALDPLPPQQVEWLHTLLDQLGESVPVGLLQDIAAWRKSSVDLSFLGTIGRIWDEKTGPWPVIEHPDLAETLGEVESALVRQPPRSVLIVGEHGVGKTSVIRAVAHRLKARKWHVFEAGHADLLAGQIFVGQLEDRLRSLVRQISGPRPIVWYIPAFHQLSWTGRTHVSPVSALDTLIPLIESGEVKLIGETTPAACEKLSLSHPRCITAMDVIRMEPLDPEATLHLAAWWADIHSPPEGPRIISPESLREAWLLAEQYIGDKAAPGSLLELLEGTVQKKAALDGPAHVSVTLDDLIGTLTQLTGLPPALIDERRELDVSALRRLFEQRVLGQPEAVDCLVDRITMIKAGVNDPTRPLGVFLFAGPTGTGKTEIAKTLAEFLFGSGQRMLRMDMSELNSPNSLSRLVGDPGDAQSSSLADQIRKQPFAVVLLDEFEKAHPLVWDVFLQVFDDGRLTDARGNTADCRHALFILTSNLGSAVPTGLRVGFSREALEFNGEQVEQTIRRTFPREFLNRLDRIVVFRPLSRETMRSILRKEIDEVFSRRGLRNRTWAVVWDDQAFEFLLEQGVTPDLGARPLKRAVERLLLTPLARTIVDHQFPEGDQFLYVKPGGDGLEVEFVDPNAPAEPVLRAPEEEPGGAEEKALPGLASIMLDSRGTHEEMACLQKNYDRVREMLESGSLTENKQAALELMSQDGFWDSPERFGLLGELEYLDRIEAAMQTAGSLLGKLRKAAAGMKTGAPRHLTARLAQQLYLLTQACETVRNREPRDAYLLVETTQDSDSQRRINREFADRLGRMYRFWAEKRRMEIKILREPDESSDGPYQLLAAVSGFGAHRILAGEEGLHVLELPEDERNFQRARVQVQVAPQPDEPSDEHLHSHLAQAERALAAARKDGLTVVRRYREQPSPLVRDGVRHWRTGRLDRVLGGDFDLYGYAEPGE
ncbi:MAG: AAA family ATPase [Acidobacteria bacterium]|nr:AAA family ATPase [Acidobacteriota bacterium]